MRRRSLVRDWHGHRVVIVGAARQGLALARYLARHGAQVVLNDLRPEEQLRQAQAALQDVQGSIEWVCGGHPLSVLERADLVCPSGGVPLSLPLIVEARRRGLPLSNDSQIFLEAAPCPVVGITGSAGKTTTTTLVGRMAQAAAGTQDGPRRAWVGGNIGSPLVAVLDEIRAQDLAVMELSSFQLEIMSIAPQLAAVLNVTPNHLDRHGSMQAYIAAKARILDFQSRTDSAVLGREDPGAWALRQRVQGRLFSFGIREPAGDQNGTFIKDGLVWMLQDGERRELLEQELVQLRGEHNLLNVLAACAIAAAAGLPSQVMRSGVAGFAGVPHRLAFVRSWGGAGWYNDSIATAPERAMAAIRSFDEPLILLAGGRDKDLPWEEFAALVSQRVRHLVLFGEAAARIQPLVEAARVAAGGEANLQSVTICRHLRQAVQAAAELVEPGVVVLLSPGGTSFDEFEDFEERGECFAKWVNNLP